ncbi:hypothetical protein F4802DRAFT_35399 [Xylaria palmicola]|nr:hypothetical protein F4802DRAFT_35399 [Xylaria palmicola]
MAWGVPHRGCLLYIVSGCSGTLGLDGSGCLHTVFVMFEMLWFPGWWVRGCCLPVACWFVCCFVRWGWARIYLYFAVGCLASGVGLFDAVDVLPPSTSNRRLDAQVVRLSDLLLRYRITTSYPRHSSRYRGGGPPSSRHHQIRHVSNISLRAEISIFGGLTEARIDRRAGSDATRISAQASRPRSLSPHMAPRRL